LSKNLNIQNGWTEQENMNRLKLL